MSARYSGRQMRYYDPAATPMPRNHAKRGRPRESRARSSSLAKTDLIRLGRAEARRRRRAERRQRGGADA